MDAGEYSTEGAFQEIKARITEIYAQAQQDVREKLEEHKRRFAAAERKKRQQLADGQITQADFDAWYRGQVFQGKQWQDKLEYITGTLTAANEAALRIVNGQRVGVFADNMTYQNFLADQHGIAGVWNVYNEAAVARLIADNPTLLPPKKLDPEKDKAWNMRQLQNCVAHGIIEGQPIDRIADRMATVTGSSNRAQMLRTARTSMVSAQNAGRLEGMREQIKMGIRVRKLWIATLDSRTRDAHQKLDGQTAEVEEPFKSELGDIMFPADPAAAPANVYNCRCALGSDFPDFPMENATRYDQEHGAVVEYRTYMDWKREHQGGTPPPKPDPTPKPPPPPPEPKKEPEKKPEPPKPEKPPEPPPQTRDDYLRARADLRAMEEAAARIKQDETFKFPGATGDDAEHSLSEYAALRDRLLAFIKDGEARIQELGRQRKYNAATRLWEEVEAAKRFLRDGELLSKKAAVEDLLHRMETEQGMTPPSRVDEIRWLVEEKKKKREPWALDETLAVGKMLQEEVDERSGLDKVTERRRKLDELFDQIEEYQVKFKELRRRRANAETPEELLAIEREEEALDAEQEAVYQKIDVLEAEQMQEKPRRGTDVFRAVLSEIRDVGGLSVEDMDDYADFGEWGRSLQEITQTKENLCKAMNLYPSDWLEQSAEHSRDLCPHWTHDRAHYDQATGEIRISGDDRANAHEMAHRFEVSVPGIRESERAFYEHRTKGEPLKWLGKGYKKTEVTRKDRFMNPYMGKDYHGRAFELLSMGSEILVNEDFRRRMAAEDPEMLRWVMAVLATM